MKRRTRRGRRPGAGDDRARRQGARGADRDPARHRACARTAQPAADPAARDGLAVWRTARRGRPPALAAAEARAARRCVRAENRRLLYVALTRAQTLAGRLRRRASAAGPARAGTAWSRRRCRARRRAGRPPGPDGRRAGRSRTTGPSAAARRRSRPPAAPRSPDWAARPPPAPPAAPAPPLSPSALGGRGAIARARRGPRRAARARGIALHRLLEALPGQPRADWPALAARLLPRTRPRRPARRGGGRARRARRSPRCSRPERWPRSTSRRRSPRSAAARILGRIDRLRRRARPHPRRRLQVATAASPPRPTDVPEAILRQMGAYAAALAAVWPGRRGRDGDPLDPRAPG